MVLWRTVLKVLWDSIRILWQHECITHDTGHSTNLFSCEDDLWNQGFHFFSCPDNCSSSISFRLLIFLLSGAWIGMFNSGSHVRKWMNEYLVSCFDFFPLIFFTLRLRKIGVFMSGYVHRTDAHCNLHNFESYIIQVPVRSDYSTCTYAYYTVFDHYY